MTDDAHDHDDLRALLRSVDPASSLPQADPTRVARLLEDTMTHQPTDESRADGTHHRSRLTWTMAAAAAVLIVGGVFFAVGGDRGDDAPAPSAGEAPSSRAGGAAAPPVDAPLRTVTELTVAAAAANGKCLVPEAAPDVVAKQETVFDGTVQSISGSAVTLLPTRFYHGDPTDLVVVQAPGQEMDALLTAVTFEEGKRYLVAATDGRVTLCGFTAEYSDSLAAVYGQAFG
ncbi:hypothetical protein [Nocardioides rubriscoriae]|uniref:hypothetical protein n=1 Tax=Nocardioides rubriscoriae TaxID=642762 RepID=UPI0011E00B12|nr:hypothetical protein [Nocardioides rubriscoriae]